MVQREGLLMALTGQGRRDDKCQLSGGKAHNACAAKCPLMTQSGHYAIEHSWMQLSILGYERAVQKWSFLIRQPPIKGTDCASFETASALGD
jgi:hypothetical protein